MHLGEAEPSFSTLSYILGFFHHVNVLFKGMIRIISEMSGERNT